MSVDHKKELKKSGASRVENIYLEKRGALMRWVSRFLNRPQDVEDIVQETFVRSYQAELERKIDNPTGYMFRTARNLCFKNNENFSHKLTDAIEDFDLLGVISDIDPVVNWLESHEQFSIFCSAVRELPIQCRRVFLLRKVYGLSHEDIADRLGITVSTSHQHLAKGLARCTAYMRDHGFLESTADSRATRKSPKRQP